MVQCLAEERLQIEQRPEARAPSWARIERMKEIAEPMSR
jgi:hypothetical protein